MSVIRERRFERRRTLDWPLALAATAVAAITAAVAARAGELGSDIGLGASRIEDARRQQAREAAANPASSLAARPAERYAAQSGEGGVSAAAVAAVPGVALAASGEAGAPGGQASGPALPAQAWALGFVYGTHTGADVRGGALTTRGGGVSVGVDRFFDPRFLAGVALTVSRASTIGIGVRTDTDAVSGAVYASWAPFGGFELDGQLGLNWAGVETSRALILNGIAVPTQGSADGLGFTALASVGHRFRVPTASGEAYLKPFVAGAYVSQERGAYTEFGATTPGLAFPAKTFERASLSLGVAAGVDLAAGDGWTLRPELRLAWARYLTDPSPPVEAFFLGAPTVLRDPDPGRNAAVVGIELTAWRTAGAQVFGGYVGEFRDNATAHQGRVGLRLTW